MYEIRSIHIASLNGSLSENIPFQAILKKMVPQDLQHLLEPEEVADLHPIALVAYKDGEPAGLALATFPLPQTAELQTLYVGETGFNPDLAEQLLLALKAELARLKRLSLFYVYSADAVETPALEQLLAKLGWEKPILYTIRCLIEQKLFNPPWLNRPNTLPAGFEEFFWKDLTERDRKQLAQSKEQHLFPLFLYPLGPEETKIELLNSLGLRFQNEIIAWLVTHRIGLDTIRYTSFYIHQKWQSSGTGMKLLCDSINLHKKTDITWGLFEVNLADAELSWIRFVKHHLVPYAAEVHRRKYIETAI